MRASPKTPFRREDLPRTVTDLKDRLLVLERLKRGGVTAWEDVGAACGSVTGGDLHGAMFDPGDLEGWYRLGEDPTWPTNAASTPNFMADQSGNHYHLTAMNKNYTVNGGGVWTPDGDSTIPLPQTNIPGALTAGDPALNDGGVKFQFNEFQWTQWDAQLVLATPVPFTERPFVFDKAGAGYTIAFWFAFVPFSECRNRIAPFNSDGHDIGYRPFCGNFAHSFGTSSGGLTFGFDPLYGIMKVSCYNAPAGPTFNYNRDVGMVPHEWTFFSMVITKNSSTNFTRRVLLNLNEVASISGTANEIGMTGTSTTGGGIAASPQFFIGGNNDDDLRFGHGAGKMDELAFWSRALTDAQLSAVYNAKVASEGDTWTPVEPGTGGSGGGGGPSGVGTAFPFDLPLAFESWGLENQDYTAASLASTLNGAGFQSVAVQLDASPRAGRTHAQMITSLAADVATLKAAGLQVVAWAATMNSTDAADINTIGAQGWIPQVEGPGQLDAVIASLGAGVGGTLPKAVVTNYGGLDTSADVSRLTGAGIQAVCAEVYAADGHHDVEAILGAGASYGFNLRLIIPILGTYAGELPSSYSGFTSGLNYGVYHVPQTTSTQWTAFGSHNASAS